jgi:hypothetical protein
MKIEELKFNEESKAEVKFKHFTAIITKAENGYNFAVLNSRGDSFTAEKVNLNAEKIIETLQIIKESDEKLSEQLGDVDVIEQAMLCLAEKLMAENLLPMIVFAIDSEQYGRFILAPGVTREAAVDYLTKLMEHIQKDPDNPKTFDTV